MEHAAIPAFHVQHHPVADLHQLRVSAQIDGAVAVHQAGEPRPVGQLEKRHQEFRVQGAFSAGDGNAPDEGNALPDLGEHLLRGHFRDLWRGVVGADGDAGIALAAFFAVPADLFVNDAQRSRRALLHARPAVHAQALGLRVMAVGAMDIALLEENGNPVPRPVHNTVWKDLVDRCGDHTERTFLSFSRLSL